MVSGSESILPGDLNLTYVGFIAKFFAVIGILAAVLILIYYLLLGSPWQHACLDAGGRWDKETQSCIGASER